MNAPALPSFLPQRTPVAPFAMRKKSLEERFWEKVLIPTETSRCWIWAAAKNQRGYGVFWFNGRLQNAQRISWEIKHGPPGSFYVLHHCDNPSCVNPRHLFIGTPKDNSNDMVSKGRQAKGRKIGDKMRGRRNAAHLTSAKALEIRALLRTGAKQDTLSEMFGVNQSTVSRIGTNKTWNINE
jgi:hypothetical protein